MAEVLDNTKEEENLVEVMQQLNQLIVVFHDKYERTEQGNLLDSSKKKKLVTPPHIFFFRI